MRPARAVLAMRNFGAAAALLGPVLPATGQLPAREPVDDVLYQFMPIAWRDSDGDEFRYGDFGGMVASLDYLAELGITGVWMTPIFPSKAYHGYQHGRADRVNEWFGTEAQFLEFVRQAHARGIKVFVDLVAYGISQDSEYFRDALKNPASRFDSWLAFTDDSNARFTGYSFPTWTGDRIGFINWDLRTPAARQQVIDWSVHWLDPDGNGDPSDGIDGYRVDHVWARYDKGPDGWGYNIESFWIPWKDALRAVSPRVFTFAEQARWETTGADLLPAHDAAFTKPFLFAVRESFSKGTAAPLAAAMARTIAELPGGLGGGKLFLGTVGDHDVDRVTSAVGGSFETAKAVAAALLTQPFPPVIYFGDEIGMLGIAGRWGTDANDIPRREPFKWNAVAGPPMTDYYRRNAPAYEARVSRDRDGRSVEEQRGVGGSLLETYRRLIALRRESVALRRGAYTAVPAAAPAVWSFLRSVPAAGDTAGQTVLVAINTASQPVTCALDLTVLGLPAGAPPLTPRDLFGGAAPRVEPVTAGNCAAYEINLPAAGFWVLELPTSPGAVPRR
jgi:alpha-amylase